MRNQKYIHLKHNKVQGRDKRSPIKKIQYINKMWFQGSGFF